MGRMALLRITWSGGSIRPWGRRASTRSSGTNTSTSSTSWLPVPRMPMASQVSSTVTPSDAMGTAMLSTIRPSSGSSNGNIVERTVPTGDWLAKILRPLTL